MKISLRWYSILMVPLCMAIIGIVAILTHAKWGSPTAAGIVAALALFFAGWQLLVERWIAHSTSSTHWSETEAVDYTILTMVSTMATSLMVSIYETAPFVTTMVVFVVFFISAIMFHEQFRGAQGLKISKEPLIQENLVPLGFFAPLATLALLLMQYMEIAKVGEYSFFILAFMHLGCFFLLFSSPKVKRAK